MMAIIGFIVLLCLGLLFVAAAIAGAFVTAGFSGKIEWLHFILFGGAGGGLLWFAFTHAPFTISIGTP